MLDKYLEGLVEESLYQIKERELQNKLKNNTGSSTCRQKNRNFSAEEQKEVEKRLQETEQFLKEHHVVPKARALCELKRVEKILIYPDHLEVLKNRENALLRQRLWICYTEKIVTALHICSYRHYLEPA